MTNEEFTKLTKKQKLLMPEEYNVLGTLGTIEKVLFIPTGKKMDGYNLSAFFVSCNGDWHRLGDYDCFRFTNCQDWLRGDFENGGVQFFSKRTRREMDC